MATKAGETVLKLIYAMADELVLNGSFLYAEHLKVMQTGIEWKNK